MSKGSAQRGDKEARAKFAAGWDTAFGRKARKKPTTVRVPGAWAKRWSAAIRKLGTGRKGSRGQ